MNNLPQIPPNLKEELEKKLFFINEKRKKENEGSFVNWIIIIVLIALILFFVFSADIIHPFILLIPAIILLVTIPLLYYNKTTKQKEFNIDFKTDVIQSVLTYLIPDLNYKPNDQVALSVIRKSGLINTLGIVGEDRFVGETNNLKYHFCEIKTKALTDNKTTFNKFTGYYSSTISKRDFILKFNGLFYECKTTQHFNHVEIHTANCTSKTNTPQSDVYKTVLPYLYIFSNDQRDLERLFKPKFISQLKDLQSIYKLDFKLSFINDRIYILIRTDYNHFDPNQNKINYKTVTRIYNEITKAKMVVDMLDETIQHI